MVLQRENVHRKGLSPRMKRKIWVLRKEKVPARAKTRPIIASKVKNRIGDVPCWKVCRDAFNQLEKPSHNMKDSFIFEVRSKANVDYWSLEVDRAAAAEGGRLDGAARY